MAGTDDPDLQELVHQATEDRSYYFGRISREDANDVLMMQGVDGSFILRMSATMEGVYTISLTQGHAVRHIRVINVYDKENNVKGCVLSEGDVPCANVWELIKTHMHSTLTSVSDEKDAVCLRFPVRCDEDVIAPDLMAAAAECGMETGDFDENVSMFLEGGVSSSRLANTRSALSNKLSNKTTRDGVLEPLDDDNSLQSQALESFMQGKISAEEFQIIREIEETRR